MRSHNNNRDSKSGIDESLGYDPRANVNSWRGTPIPPCDNPLAATPELVEIAKKMWWNGDPWTILRNRKAYLAHAMDWTTHEEFLYLWNNVSREDWVEMLLGLRPGQVSARSYRLCMKQAGLLPIGTQIDREWTQNLHVKDMVFANFRPIWQVRGYKKKPCR